ncbi:mechanosensitive ion channel family protein [Phocaeicola salanitronis]|uniref:mechanosensitive ion channel family protein n=1 Tax=Phocaeicola salanitronis TaxID=376805 RepID=UPI001C3990CB|nr:mechanosensitive ion channel domain-containing protein [Phocaeicola salanitronis]MDM8306719.1 mechanosensitive ion channel [Phocaeicola salanitronis]HJC98366.1 mechanosensitive ion channel family protein [Candidatus Phocaeicola merdavium]
MEHIDEEIARLLLDLGIDKANLNWTTRVTMILAILLVSYIVTKLFRHALIPAVRKITAKTKATWDDYLFNDDMLHSFSRMIPPIIFYLLLPFVFDGYPHVLAILLKACLIYLIVVTLMLIRSFLKSIYEISSEHEALRYRPLKGIYQMVLLLAIAVGIILIISILIDQNAATILAGLGASAAVLMLIFKDSILGLVAGVQLSANDMLRPGDWVTMAKYGADGYVLEVSLTTVKVQNFDKTITTIPPYALVSDSFQNWRGMWENGSRRIKRSLYIDMTTVRFCTGEEVRNYVENGWIEAPEKGGEPMVNLQAYRMYLLAYLQKNPKVNHDMMIMVRQLQPTPEGLPLEVYCFADTIEWLKYEAIQNDLFNHFIAVLPRFGLRVYQHPSGSDLARFWAADNRNV